MDHEGSHSEFPSDYPDEDPASRQARKGLERVIRDTVRKGLERGVETLGKTDETLRGLVGDLKLPKEVAGYVFSQVDETKNAVVRVVAREVRLFLEATDFATEIQRALTALSFEIKTEVRFIPNDAGGVKPNVRAKVRPKKSAPPPEQPQESTTSHESERDDR